MSLPVRRRLTWSAAAAAVDAEAAPADGSGKEGADACDETTEPAPQQPAVQLGDARSVALAWLVAKEDVREAAREGAAGDCREESCEAEADGDEDTRMWHADEARAGAQAELARTGGDEVGERTPVLRRRRSWRLSLSREQLSLPRSARRLSFPR